MMLEQQLKLIEEPEIDFECPDCQSLLTVYYDGRQRYFCENCDEEKSARDIARDDGDNDINTASDSEVF